EGNLIPIEKDVQVKELKKPTTEFQERSLDIKKRRLALDREKARKGKASSKKDLKDKIWKEMAAAEKTARSSDEFMTLEPSQQAQHIDKIREAAGFKFYAYEKGFKPQRNKKTGEMVYVEKIGRDKIRVYNEFGQELPAPGEKPSKKQLAGGNKFKKLLTMDYKKNKEKKYKSSKITGETGAPLISEGLKRIPGQVVSAGGTVVKGAGGLLGKAGGALMESQRKARKESLGF
ncbi:MAG: hypothetical protein JJV89_02495, partial [Desulfosarcina sp.]|nr:hypothetical protein [Desulfobacterales bacterium]